ncbi:MULTISPECIES: type 1 glutamine amidotransferase [Halomonadaceae]|uniref:type 1 glutamine amidotransferase n=1 Tax=Halomonadaceae TaxID=28256 RepID=UPI000A282543|nr:MULTISPECIES: type 1 glutamine amidotransferase [Halomonas]MDR5887507.1 type 1 glutamine amidotransferase [Halomonas janggokensis]QPL46592.1 type 1 glutamine amidotransferase [Halomonas sp. A40-4]
MHIHLLQHGPDHGPARLTDWLTSMGHSFTIFHLYDHELVPRASDSDALIVLDGPDRFIEQPPAWFKAENKLINRYLDGQKPLLGIGLGALWIADALGSVVALGTYPESGWHTIHLAPESPIDLPEQFDAFMWHRYVFSLPDDALPCGGSEAAPLQGFSWDAGRVVGLLCHLEVTQESIEPLLARHPLEAERRDFLQTEADIRQSPKRFDTLAALLDRLLSQWLRPASL